MLGLIAYRNLADEWPLDIDGGPGTDNQAVAGYPATNIRTRQLQSVARIANHDTVNGNPLTIPFAPVASVTANLVVLYGSVPSNINVVGLTGSGAISPFLTDYNSDLGLPTISYFLIPANFGDVVKVELEYGLVFPPSYVEVARLYVANALVLPVGVDATWALGVDDTGGLDSSYGRQWYESPGVRTRRLSVTIGAMSTALAFGFADGASSAFAVPSIQGLQLEAGATGEVIVIPRAESGLWIRRAAMYGHLERVPVIRHRAGPIWSTEFTVIEER